MLLQSDGTVIAVGTRMMTRLRHVAIPCGVPSLEPGVFYVQVATGPLQSMFLRSDGAAVADQEPLDEEAESEPGDWKMDIGVSRAPAGKWYTQISVGGEHVLRLRNDGIVIARGCNFDRQCEIPSLDTGTAYVQVSGGIAHTVLLRSDGTATACGNNDDGQCVIPRAPSDMCYIQVSAGGWHTLLLRNDGSAVAVGSDNEGQCRVPPLIGELLYTQVSAGLWHSVFLRSDGNAVNCGRRELSGGEIPSLPEGLRYVEVAAGSQRTALLRSDGVVVTCGGNGIKQCNLYPDPCKTFVGSLLDDAQLIVQCVLKIEEGLKVLSLYSLAGENLLNLVPLDWLDLAWDIHLMIARELHQAIQRLQILLPDGRLLAKLCETRPGITISDLFRDYNAA